MIGVTRQAEIITKIVDRDGRCLVRGEVENIVHCDQVMPYLRSLGYTISYGEKFEVYIVKGT